ncbi:MAG: iron-sulfur binding hydrogenase, partial [Spirochaetales bacterium]|nr:iron-sulfur binding hydrogenase [Spirochaetales bacterium]
MKIEHLSTRYGFEAVLVPDGLVDIVDAYSSDLLSDVMANAVEGSVLITIQAHLNTIAVASLVGIR